MTIEILERSGGRLRAAQVHKHLLNAFQSVDWLQQQGAITERLDQLFTETAGFSDHPNNEGWVIIDRDQKRLAGCQRFLALDSMGVLADPTLVAQARHFDLVGSMDDLGQKAWPQLFSLTVVRAHLLGRAYDAGACTRVRAGRLTDTVEWQPFQEIGAATLEAAADWLEQRRAALSGGDCVVLDTGFEFAPLGWTIEEFDVDPAGVERFMAAQSAAGIGRA